MRPFETPRIVGLKRKSFADIFYIIFIAVIGVFIVNNFEPPTEIISPIPVQAEEEESLSPIITSTPTPTPLPSPKIDTPEKEDIVKYIRQVFGKHSDKALLLLTCENSDIDPNAKNTAGNSPAGSTDWGVFQINDYWQEIYNPAFLTDYKINTLVAHNIFTRDGESFKLWTCGRKFGI